MTPFRSVPNSKRTRNSERFLKRYLYAETNHPQPKSRQFISDRGICHKIYFIAYLVCRPWTFGKYIIFTLNICEIYCTLLIEFCAHTLIVYLLASFSEQIVQVEYASLIIMNRENTQQEYIGRCLNACKKVDNNVVCSDDKYLFHSSAMPCHRWRRKTQNFRGPRGW